jgi:GTP cyclohydrolase III
MATYRVKWVIDVEADTPAEAATSAWETLRRQGEPDSWATVLDVWDEHGDERIASFDMEYGQPFDVEDVAAAARS